MERENLDERVDAAVEEMRSGVAELEERRDKLDDQTEATRRAAQRAHDASPGMAPDDEDEGRDEDAPTTAEEGDAVDEAEEREG